MAETPAPNTEPITYLIDGAWAKQELDYSDMVALSGMFRRWAVHEENIKPILRTKMILWSADLEAIAEWVGRHWRSADPSLDMPILKFLALAERRTSNVTMFEGREKFR